MQIKQNEMKINLITLAGVVLSMFGYLLVLAITKLRPLSDAISEQFLTVFGLILIWILTVTLLFIIRRGENKALSSIGMKSISIKEIIIAIGLGIILSVTVPLLTLIVGQMMPATTNGGNINEISEKTSWLMLLASILTAGITEEIVFRGYLIERLIEITKKTWLAIVISAVAFVLPHTLSWDKTHLIAVVLPMGLILSGLYL